MGILDSILNAADALSDTKDMLDDVRDEEPSFDDSSDNKSISSITDPDDLSGMLYDISDAKKVEEIIDKYVELIKSESQEDMDSGLVDDIYDKFLYDDYVKVSKEELHNLKMKVAKLIKTQDSITSLVTNDEDKDVEVKKLLISKWTDQDELDYLLSDGREDDAPFDQEVYMAARARLDELTGEKTQPAKDMIYICYKFTLKCTNCGNDTPLSSLDDTQKCGYCFEEIKVGDFIKGLMEDLDMGGSMQVFMNGGSANVNSAEEPVLCGSCSEPLENLDSIKPGEPAVCGKCNFENPTSAAEDWLQKGEKTHGKNFHKYKPTMVFLRPDADDTLKDEEGGNPIAFACQKCSATLDIDKKTPRVLKCKYCNADQYLPDDLWKSLHPVPIIPKICIRWEKVK